MPKNSEASELRGDQAIAEPDPSGVSGALLGPAQRRCGGRDKAVPQTKGAGIGGLLVGTVQRKNVVVHKHLLSCDDSAYTGILREFQEQKENRETEMRVRVESGSA